jgi:hypothetical protein
MSSNVLSQRVAIQATSRAVCLLGEFLGPQIDVIRDRHRSFHTISITLPKLLYQAARRTIVPRAMCRRDRIANRTPTWTACRAHRRTPFRSYMRGAASLDFRLKLKSVRRPVRYQIKHGPAVAGHNDRLAVFHRTRKLGQPIFRISNGNGLHQSHCGHKWLLCHHWNLSPKPASARVHESQFSISMSIIERRAPGRVSRTPSSCAKSRRMRRRSRVRSSIALRRCPK